MSAPAPFVPLVEVTRGSRTESLHSGAAAIVDRTGRLIWAAGDPELAVYPRSCIKPFQALQLIESGAADRYGLGVEELALACASHSGEPEHVRRVGQWLEQLGLEVGALGCGTHWPSHEGAMLQLARAGGTPCALHNNCSGKHTGMLCTALHRGDALQDYLRREHPIQAHWIAALSEAGAEDLTQVPHGIDGCSLPTIPLSLSALARAFAWMARAHELPGARAAAIVRLRQAMMAEAWFVAGTGRDDTRLMQAARGAIVTKAGAEGVYVAAIPQLGLGLALKIADGAGRAAASAMAALLARALADTAHGTALAAEAIAPITSRAGAEVGTVRPLPVLDPAAWPG